MVSVALDVSVLAATIAEGAALAGKAAIEASALARVTNCLRFMSVIFYTPLVGVVL